ncbi:MAG: dienelactone hydrolase family protein [Candidatus Scalindua sp.]|nr:dienelactone hydrolase family protein [Candidatus Scalindua sp.]
MLIVMIEEHVYFKSGGMKVEGIISYDEEVINPPALLLCPPHPHLGGDMDNNVITTLASESAEREFVTLRFNYCGVGKSESCFENVAEQYNYWEDVLNNDDYADALADASAALEFLESVTGSDVIYAVGYSFGAIVAMMLSARHERIRSFALISLPFGRFKTHVLADCTKPKYIVCADNDFATPIEEVKKGVSAMAEPKRLEILQECDHFYIGREHDVANRIIEFFTSKNSFSQSRRDRQEE